MIGNINFEIKKYYFISSYFQNDPCGKAEGKITQR